MFGDHDKLLVSDTVSTGKVCSEMQSENDFVGK